MSLDIGRDFSAGCRACFTCFETRIVMNLREAASPSRTSSRRELFYASPHASQRQSLETVSDQ